MIRLKKFFDCDVTISGGGNQKTHVPIFNVDFVLPLFVVISSFSFVHLRKQIISIRSLLSDSSIFCQLLLSFERFYHLMVPMLINL